MVFLNLFFDNNSVNREAATDDKSMREEHLNLEYNVI